MKGIYRPNSESGEHQLSEKIAYSIDDVITLTGIKRTKIYAEIKAGRLKIRKCGARTIVLAADLNRWLEALPKE